MAFFIQKTQKNQEKMKYENSIVPIKVLSGENGQSITVSTKVGFITRAIIVSSTPDNTGMVRAAIEDNSGQKLAEMQALEVYRSREVNYENDGVPVRVHGGNQITFKISATANFDSDFTADLILVYGPEEPCYNL